MTAEPTAFRSRSLEVGQACVDRLTLAAGRAETGASALPDTTERQAGSPAGSPI